MGRLDTTPLLTSKELSSQEGLPDLRMRNMWSLIFYLGRARPLLSIVLEFLSTGNELKLLSLGRVVVVVGLSSGAAARRVDPCTKAPKP